MSGLVAAGLALFGAGLAATLSPCVLPLVPGWVGVVCDASSPDQANPRAQRLQRVALFVVGVAGTFALLGAGAGALGVAVDADRIGRFAGAVVILLAVVMLAGRAGRGRRIVRELRLVRHLPASPRLRAFVLGIACGTAWTPCAGPLLGAAITAAGTTGSAWRGTVLLVAYAGGVLTPFVALAATGVRRVPAWWRPWSRRLGVAGATVMLAIGVALVAGWYQQWIAHLPVGV